MHFGQLCGQNFGVSLWSRGWFAREGSLLLHCKGEDDDDVAMDWASNVVIKCQLHRGKSVCNYTG